MRYVRMPIEIESPEQMGYGNIKYNLTESSFRDAHWRDLGIDLDDLVIMYSDHRGLAGLRGFLAKETGVGTDDVLITVGAASALFIVATSLLEAGDRLLVVRPNYATNIETPRAIRAEIDYFDLTFSEGYRINIDRLAAQIRPGTKLVSITNPHNPTGTMISEAELLRLVEVTRSKGCHLLVDETYRDMAFQTPPALAASVADHVISVSSLSKTYGLPGIRIGWLINRNPKLMEIFLAAKEQIYITGSVVDEEIAYRYLQKKQQFFPAIQKTIASHLKITRDWLEQEKRMAWVQPDGGVVCFPHIRDSANVDIEKFYRTLNGKYETFVGPGHWFEQPRNFMRIGYGWPTLEELKGGLENVSRAISESLIR